MSWAVEVHRTRRCGHLRSGLWQVDGEPRSVCLFLPGLGDFLEKRADLAGRLAAMGHAVLSLDWCGQGGSGRLAPDPGAAHAESFEHYGQDVLEVIAARAPSGLPQWLLAYSMGATVALPLLAAGVLSPQAVALVSPMLRLPLPAPETLARMAAEIAVLLGRGRAFAPGEAARPESMGAAPADVTDAGCRARLADLAAASPGLPLVGATWGWSRAALVAMPRARRADWRGGPTLIATASRESSVDLSPVPRLASRLSARVVELDGGHDLFLAGPATRERLLAEIGATLEPALARPERAA